jgi:RNase P/RNase MRP subunit POP5
MTPITLLLDLEVRSRKDVRHEYYTCEMAGPEDATLESLSPFILEKTSESFGYVQVKRIYLKLVHYDSEARRLYMTHSEVASKASAFTLDLEWHYGWKRSEPFAIPETATA